LETSYSQKVKTAIEEIVKDDRYYEALNAFIEQQKRSWFNKLGGRRKGSLIDDMGKLADANSSYATLDDLSKSLTTIRNNIT